MTDPAQFDKPMRLWPDVERQIGELSHKVPTSAWLQVLPLLNRCSQIIKGFEERFVSPPKVAEGATPRTDELTERYCDFPVMANHARQLERELAEAVMWRNEYKARAEALPSSTVTTQEELGKVELYYMQMAAICTASGQNTRESIKQRIGKDNPYWTPAYQDMCTAVDREIELRERLSAIAAPSAVAEELPREPTQAMLNAARAAHFGEEGTDAQIQKVWTEMYDAALSGPSQSK